MPEWMSDPRIFFYPAFFFFCYGAVTIYRIVAANRAAKKEAERQKKSDNEMLKNLGRSYLSREWLENGLREFISDLNPDLKVDLREFSNREWVFVTLNDSPILEVGVNVVYGPTVVVYDEEGERKDFDFGKVSDGDLQEVLNSLKERLEKYRRPVSVN